MSPTPLIARLPVPSIFKHTTMAEVSNVVIQNNTSRQMGELEPDVMENIRSFALECEPLEKDALLLLEDLRTGAIFVECHVRASKIVLLGTTDVPLDPDEQPEHYWQKTKRG